MTGMTTIGATSFSSYDNRTVTIAISGLCHQETSRTSNYAIQVPYSRLSATLKSIRRSGAKILSVTLNGHPAPSQAAPSQAAQPVITAAIEPAIEPAIAKPVATSPVATTPTATTRTAQPVAHGHGFRVDSDPKKSKKRKR